VVDFKHVLEKEKATKINSALLTICKEVLELLEEKDPVTVGCHCTSTDDMDMPCVWCRMAKVVAEAEGR
jgi:hypothetical protein